MAGEQADTGLAAARAQLHRVRTESRPHWVALVAAVVVGLVLSGVHWLGLVAAAVWALLLAVPGALGGVVAMGRIAGLGLLIALVAPVVGSLARGVV